MDANLIYSQHREDAFASLMEASEYSVFVAMPFGNRFRYQASDVYKDIIQPAAERANEILGQQADNGFGRRFGKPKRVDDRDRRGRDIHNEIVKAILHAHVVVADLTLSNDGVLIELGMALAFKPLTGVVLLSQEDPTTVHFDVKTNVILRYTSKNDAGAIALAMVAAVSDFEAQRAEYLTSLEKRLSPDAIRLMGWYGKLRTKQHGIPGSESQDASLHEAVGVRAFWPDQRSQTEPDAQQGIAAMTRYQLALRELIEKRLIWTHYVVNQGGPGIDMFSGRGTKLGWMFIERLWPDTKRPADEFSAPTPA